LEAEFIQTRETWEKFTKALSGAAIVALATEDSSLYAYRGALCLVQAHVETREGASLLAVIDVLTLSRDRSVSLHALWSALPSEAVVVMHGGEYAVAALRQLGRPGFSGLSDTQQAADLLGLPQTGYRTLCASLLGIAVSQGHGFDWRQRPLAAGAVTHAVQDVAHLPALYHALALRIRAAELDEEWAIAGQTVLLTSVDANRADPENAWNTKESREIPGPRRALFKGLLEWRERKARDFDCPPGKVIPTRTLLALATAAGPDLDARLGEGFHSRLTYPDREDLKRLWCGLVAASDDAVPSPGAHREAPLGPPQTARLKRLKAWRREEAAGRAVGLQAVLPASALLHIARRGIDGLKDAPQIGAARRARYEMALTEVLKDPVD